MCYVMCKCAIRITVLLTMYMGEPQRVAAITPSCRKRAKPKSAEKEIAYN